MPVYGYEIGLTSTTTNLESLTIPVNPPRGRFYQASVFNDKADGQVAAHGSPYAVWLFDILTEAMVYQLRQFCTNGISSSVYIVTRVPPDDSNQTERFIKYSGIMVWPTRETMDRRRGNGRYTGLEFNFRHLEEV